MPPEERDRGAEQDREPAHRRLMAERTREVAVDQRMERGTGVMGVVGNAGRPERQQDAGSRRGSGHHGGLGSPHMP